LYASFVFDPQISIADASYLLGLASKLTYHQLSLLALLHSDVGYRQVPGWERLHPYEWRATALAGELCQLAQAGLVERTDRRPVLSPEDANPSVLWVSPTGCKLYHWAKLDRIDDDELADVYQGVQA